MKGSLSTLGYLSFISVISLFSYPVRAAGELFIFPEIRLEQMEGNSFDHASTVANVDLFASVQYRKIKFLGELFVSKSGSGEIKADFERLKIGYQLSPDSTLWLGRAHNPVSYWNTQYYHANYLQPSISRPEIEMLDHDGGLLPSHIVGLLVEMRQQLGDGDLNYTFAIGTGPQLRPSTNRHGASGLTLHPVNVFNPNKGNHKYSVTARVGYRPDMLSDNQLGAFATHTVVPIDDVAFDKAVISAMGVFARWDVARFTLNGALFLFNDKVSAIANTTRGDFSSAYIQVDYRASDEWILFSRLENTSEKESDPYLKLMTGFAGKRHAAGVRWDITSRQAIKLEVSREHEIGGSVSNAILSWTAVFP
ncbi:MAG: hypothetical protein GXP22_06605 [Gammaproteobacteria bacterium]|nr:hypothetical protein [Gammaproteobacteria bacterium]